MKNTLHILSVFFATLLLLGSCAQVKQADYGEINSLGAQRTLEVVLWNKKHVEVDSLNINIDSARWISRKYNWLGLVNHVGSVSFPTSDIRKIVVVPDRVLITAAGTLVGGFIGMAVSPPDVRVLLYMAGRMLLGVIIGAIISGNFFRTEYIINPALQ